MMTDTNHFMEATLPIIIMDSTEVLSIIITLMDTTILTNQLFKKESTQLFLIRIETDKLITMDK